MAMIRYTKHDGGIIEVVENEYNVGAIHMLRMISKEMGWEESQDEMFKKFFEFPDKNT